MIRPNTERAAARSSRAAHRRGFVRRVGAQHRGDEAGDLERRLRIRRLVGARAAQHGERRTERRRERGAGRLEQVLGFLDDRVAGDARPADLRDGVDQQPRALSVWPLWW
jgi:hypothetical protein